MALAVVHGACGGAFDPQGHIACALRLVAARMARRRPKYGASPENTGGKGKQQFEGQPRLGDWERQSRALEMPPGQRAQSTRFRDYFQKEMEPCQDGSLKRDLDVLDQLARKQP